MTAEDRLRMELDLLPILPPAEMEGLLRDALERGGWSRRGDGVVTTRGGAEVRVEDGVVTATLAGRRQVTAQGSSVAAAEQAAKAQAAGTREALEAEITRKLTKVEAELRGELECAVQRVYVEALKKKAAQMGEVEHTDERVEDGEVTLTIRVKV